MYFSKFLTEEQKGTDRVKKSLNRMKVKIENDIPFIDLQFNRVL